MEAMELLGGHPPQMLLMIVIFLSFTMLVVMFFLLVRIADDLRKTVRGVAGPMHEQMGLMREQLEDLIRVQYEILNAIAPQDAKKRDKARAAAAAAGAGPAGTKSVKNPGGPTGDSEDLLQGNITDFILDE